MQAINKLVYEAFDGSIFNNSDECLGYENTIQKKTVVAKLMELIVDNSAYSGKLYDEDFTEALLDSPQLLEDLLAISKQGNN